MPRYEYKVVPAPKKPGKINGVRGTEHKFAAELSTLMNTLGAEGWEYQRTDTLPCEERQGFTGRVTTFQNMLVFRREIKDLSEDARRGAAQVEAEPVLAVPAFRSTAAAGSETRLPRLGGAQSDTAEGPAPDLGGTSPEPGRAPGIAAQ